MNILSLLNSAPMYAICGGIIAFVAVVCAVFMVRAYRAGLAMGIDRVKLKRAITSSATFSLLPSVGILLGVIALSGSLGTPWPWLRLSVIGALHYETQVAQAAAEQVGMSSLSAAEMTPSGFATIALLMSVCIMWGMVLSIFFNKRYLGKLGGGRKGSGGTGWRHRNDRDVYRSCVGIHRQLHRRLCLRRRSVFVLGQLYAADSGGRIRPCDGRIYIPCREKEACLGRKLLDRRKHAYRHGRGGRGQAIYVRRRAMNNNYFESYNKRTHVIGRISSAIVLVMLVGAPFLIGKVLGAMPDIGAAGKAFLSVGLVWTVSSVVEFLVYTPMLGAGGGYLAFITGNLINMKIPCAVNARDIVGAKTGTPENEIVSTLSIATSSLVTIIVLALGVALLVPLQPVLQSPTLQPAFENVVPALFGAMAYKYFRGNMKIAAAPLIVMSILFILVPSLTGSTSFMIIPAGALAIGIAYKFYRKAGA